MALIQLIRDYLIKKQESRQWAKFDLYETVKKMEETEKCTRQKSL